MRFLRFCVVFFVLFRVCRLWIRQRLPPISQDSRARPGELPCEVTQLAMTEKKLMELYIYITVLYISTYIYIYIHTYILICIYIYNCYIYNSYILRDSGCNFSAFSRPVETSSPRHALDTAPWDNADGRVRHNLPTDSS